MTADSIEVTITYQISTSLARAVDRVWVPVNKIGLSTLWIGLDSLITVVAVFIVSVKRGKKQQQG